MLLDLGDTFTPAWEMTATIIASAAHNEQRPIGQRTRERPAAKRAAGVWWTSRVYAYAATVHDGVPTNAELQPA